MKITPISQGTGTPGTNLGAISIGRTGSDRIAAAKAIAAGETPVRTEPTEIVDPQVARMKRIKMRTQMSTDRVVDTPFEEPLTPEEVVQNATPDAIEQPVAEEVKPLSPQFAALARQKRALQVKERELQQREQALAEKTGQDAGRIDLARLQAEPLSVLEEAGALTDGFYNSLTERILNGQTTNPAASAEKIKALEAKIAALETGIDTKLSDRDAQAEKQVLSEMRREADQLVAGTEDFKYVRAMKRVPTAIELIHRTYKQTGEVLDVSEALREVDAECRKEYDALTSQLTPAQQAAQEQQQIQRPQGMRTLTNRDGARPQQMSRRDRAIAAMNGTLKRS